MTARMRLMVNYILGRIYKLSALDSAARSRPGDTKQKILVPAARVRRAAELKKTKMPPQSKSVEAARRRVEKLIF